MSAAPEAGEAEQCTYGVSPIGRRLIGLLIIVLATPFALFSYFGYPVMVSQGKGAPLVYGFAVVSAVMFITGVSLVILGHRVRIVLTDTRVVVKGLLTSEEMLLTDIRRIYRSVDAIVLEGDARKLRLDDWYFNGKEDIRSFAGAFSQRVGPGCKFALDLDSPRWLQ